jgi:hypothetical protein
MAVAIPHTLISGFKHVNGDSCRLRFFVSMFSYPKFPHSQIKIVSVNGFHISYDARYHVCALDISTGKRHWLLHIFHRALNSEMNFEENEYLGDSMSDSRNWQTFNLLIQLMLSYLVCFLFKQNNFQFRLFLNLFDSCSLGVV